MTVSGADYAKDCFTFSSGVPVLIVCLLVIPAKINMKYKYSTIV